MLQLEPVAHVVESHRPRTAGHVDDVADDHATDAAHEDDGHVGHLLGSTVSARWDPVVSEVPVAVGHEHRGRGRARGDAVHGDPAGDQLLGKPKRKPAQAPLREGVRGDGGTQARRRADIQNVARARRRDEPPRKRLRQEVRASQVGINRQVEAVNVAVGNGSAGDHAGVVHEDVEWCPEKVFGLREGAGESRDVDSRAIENDAGETSPGLHAHPFQRSVDTPPVPSGDTHRRPVSSERRGDGKADSRGPARDDRHAPLEQRPV